MEELKNAIDKHGEYKIDELLRLISSNDLEILSFILVILRNVK